MIRVNECGTIFVCDMGGPRDNHGCCQPSGHQGPHEFTGDDGNVYRWTTDWECDCDHCRSCDGDFCVVYWTAGADDETCQDQARQVDPNQMLLF